MGGDSLSVSCVIKEMFTNSFTRASLKTEPMAKQLECISTISELHYGKFYTPKSAKNLSASNFNSKDFIKNVHDRKINFHEKTTFSELLNL